MSYINIYYILKVGIGGKIMGIFDDEFKWRDWSERSYNDDDIRIIKKVRNEEEKRKRYDDDEEDDFLLDSDNDDIDYDEDDDDIDYDEDDNDYDEDLDEDDDEDDDDNDDHYYPDIDDSIDISQIKSAAKPDFNTPLDYYINGQWYLQKAICDKFPKETELCDQDDEVNDIIVEVYSKDKNAGINVWRWLINHFSKAVKSTDNSVYEEVGDLICFGLMQFEKEYGANPKNNFFYNCLTSDIEFFDKVIEPMSMFFLGDLIEELATNNKLELIKRIGLQKLAFEKTAESARNTNKFLSHIIDGINDSKNKVDKEFIEYIKSLSPYLKNKDRIIIESDVKDLIEDERIHGVSIIEEEDGAEEEESFSQEEMQILQLMQCAIDNIENGIEFNEGYENSEIIFDFCFYYPNSKSDVVSYLIMSEFGEVTRLNENQWIGKIPGKEIEKMLYIATVTNALKRYVRYGKYFVTIENEDKTEIEINMPLYNWLEKYSNIAKLFLLQNHVYNNNYDILNCKTDRMAFNLWKNYDLSTSKEINIKYDTLKKDGKIFKGSISEYRLFLLAQYLYADAIHRYTADWLEDLSLDIFIPSLNTAIEYNGMTYDIMKIAINEEYANKTKIRDERKKLLCEKQGVNLYVWNEDIPIEKSIFNSVINIKD